MFARRHQLSQNKRRDAQETMADDDRRIAMAFCDLQELFADRSCPPSLAFDEVKSGQAEMHRQKARCVAELPAELARPEKPLLDFRGRIARCRDKGVAEDESQEIGRASRRAGA